MKDESKSDIYQYLHLKSSSTVVSTFLSEFLKKFHHLKHSKFGQLATSGAGLSFLRIKFNIVCEFSIQLYFDPFCFEFFQLLNWMDCYYVIHLLLQSSSKNNAKRKNLIITKFGTNESVNNTIYSSCFFWRKYVILYIYFILILIYYMPQKCQYVK